MPWLVAPSVTAASPVRIAGPDLDAGPEATDRVDQVEAGADRPLGVVLVGDRARPRAPSPHRR